MVDWKDTKVIKTAADIFSKSLLCFLGLYFWEVVVTFDFDASFFSSIARRKWRWHYLCYFVCRYSFLIALILLNITLNTSLPMDCQSIYVVNQLFGNVAIGTASLNLAFRALAIWRNNRVLTALMVILAVGHWVVLFFGTTTLKAAKNIMGPEPPCMVTNINHPWLVALYAYTMAFDTFIMIACLWGLWRSKPRSGGRTNDLYRLLWTDGLVYFICASVANAFPVAFLGLALNPALDIVTTIAAACVTTIVSCRAVQRLTAWGTSNPPTQDSAYRMSVPNRSGRGEIRKPKTSDATGIEHGHKPWSKRQYYPTEGDVHLSSVMFAKTVYGENERGDPENGIQYDKQQKTPTDGGVFSLPTDDRSMTSSPTAPARWKESPSIRSRSTQATTNDKDKTSTAYKPVTTRVSEASEQAGFPARPTSLYQTSESIEEEEVESGYRSGKILAPPPSALPRPRRASRVIEVGPTESGIGFGSGDSDSDRERQQQQQHRRWHGQ